MIPATGDPAVQLKLYVPYAGHPPSVNAAIRSHGAAHSATVEGWRDNATVAARQATTKLRFPVPLEPSLIRITVPVATNRRRDPHNYVGTVCKSIIDGLVLARWWPDDTPEHVTVLEPRLPVLPGMGDPRTVARAHALVQVVPYQSLKRALAEHPELAALFDK